MKNRLFYILVVFLLMFSCKNVYAIKTSSEVVQSRFYTIDMVYEESVDGNSVPNYQYLLESTDNISGSHYIILIKTATSSKPDLNNYFDCNNTGCTAKTSTVVGKLNPVVNGVINVDQDIYLANGYDYAYVITMTKSGDTYKFTMSDKAINIKKPNLPAITARYKVTTSANSITVVPLMPHSTYNGSAGIGSHTLVTKVGKVTDSDLAKKLKNNDANAYQTLLAFAQNDQEATQWDRVDTDESFLPFGDLKISNGSLYYIYTNYTDSGSIYKSVDGLTLAVGKDGTLATTFDWNKDFSFGHKFNIVLVFLGAFGVLIIGAVIFYIRSIKAADKKEKNKKKGPNYTGLDLNSFDNLGQLSKPTPPPYQNPNDGYNNGYNNYGNNYDYNNNGYNNGYNNYGNNDNNYNNYNNNNYR